MTAFSQLSKPTPLSADHEIGDFCSGVPVLDDWLKRRAMANQSSGASRCFVLCAGNSIAGYYALAAGSVMHREAIGAVRRNMPDPIPVMILARLAIDARWQKKGLGRALLHNAVHRVLGVSEETGVRALLVHAISDDAAKFYQRFGFQPSPVDDKTLMVALPKLRALSRPSEPEEK